MNKLNAALAKVLEIKEESIHDNLKPDDVDTWDSLHGLMLLSEIEGQFDVKFSMAEVSGMKCVKDIKEALVRHGASVE
jgi:acyl carrier protein